MPSVSPRNSSEPIEMTSSSGRDRVPDLAPLDELVGDLTAVEARAERAEAAHQASFAGLVAGPAPRPRGRRREQGALGRPEALGVEAGQPVALPEELGARQDRHHRLGEHEHDDDVDQRREAEGEREARARCRPRGRRARRPRGTTRSRRPGSCAGRAPSRSRRRRAATCRRGPRRAVVRSRRRTSRR